VQFKKDFGHEVTEKVKIRLEINLVDAPGAEVTIDGNGKTVINEIKNM
jgi:hypothetical protein